MKQGDLFAAPPIPAERPRHGCHAEACLVEVPPALLMCPSHWRKVPALLKAEVWRAYRRGQEFRKDPTRAYLEAARAAIEAVAKKEGRRPAP